VIERSVILSQGHWLEIPELTSNHPLPMKSFQTLEGLERTHILSTLQATAWVISGPKGAAAILGINPNTLRSRMLKLGIKRE